MVDTVLSTIHFLHVPIGEYIELKQGDRAPVQSHQKKFENYYFYTK